ncbi:hypothetical protein XM38_028920 [Halomicronema hongdechloris C2206]|uniref:Uncharacterized protein n=1 Tax=Halomicronema hongdechloris C2206 TaxID=1641165 RepID=A0A1Z3HNR2_9CYAN|nr:hypothetical protein XM38_028920 [Halomicronema hongdechloris C2206]
MGGLGGQIAGKSLQITYGFLAQQWVGWANSLPLLLATVETLGLPTNPCEQGKQKGRRQKAEIKAEGRRQKAEGRRQKQWVGWANSLPLLLATVETLGLPTNPCEQGKQKGRGQLVLYDFQSGSAKRVAAPQGQRSRWHSLPGGHREGRNKGRRQKAACPVRVAAPQGQRSRWHSLPGGHREGRRQKAASNRGL